MTARILRCDSCNLYTIENVCPKCGKNTHAPAPPKYSPEDRTGVYRRKDTVDSWKKRRIPCCEL